MENEFVSYKIALELKKLGFNKHSFGSYRAGSHQLDIIENDILSNFTIFAPLYQQAFEFFREKYNLLGNVYSNASGYGWEISDAIGGTSKDYSMHDGDCEMSGMFTTFNKAEMGCIEKLIKITKNGKL